MKTAHLLHRYRSLSISYIISEAMYKLSICKTYAKIKITVCQHLRLPLINIIVWFLATWLLIILSFKAKSTQGACQHQNVLD